MNTDHITEIRVDATGRLCVVPKANSFPLIYRAAMEVHWDEKGKYLYSPPRREWTYVRWFQQIIAAVKGEYGCALVITSETVWKNVDDAAKLSITSAAGSA
jgi:integron cassette Hfx-like protein